MASNNTQQQLRPGTLLQGGQFTYTIGQVLGQGGFGITYLSTTDMHLVGPLGRITQKTNVAIKEFFMKDYCERDSSQSTDITVSNTNGRERVDYYRRRFMKEANNVSKLQHENIVKVLEVFEANNTVYIAMEYIAGITLSEYVRSHGTLSEAEALGCIRQVAAALAYTHSKHITHLDLKPLNILRQSDGTLKVIDFGLSKQYDAAGVVESSSIDAAGITEGYSPLELYDRGSMGSFSPESDIYSLGATLYFMLTGTTPPSAPQLIRRFIIPDTVSPQMATVIRAAMLPNKEDRPQSIAAFLALLDGDAVVDDEETKPLQEEEETKGLPDEEEETQDLQGGKQKPDPQPDPQPAPKAEPAPQPKPASKPAPPKKPAENLTLLWIGIGISVVLIVNFLFFKPSRHSSDTAGTGADSTLIAVIDSAATSPPAATESRQSFEPEMVYVQGGTFMMGSPTSEANHESDEVQHQVTVSSFRIGKYEVTQGQWEAVMGSNPSYYKKGDNYPVEAVSWNGIQTFLQKLNAATGKRYRLPTEAEWEYAARGGSRSSGYLYSGSNSVGNVAWYGSNSSSSTHPVGQKSPNELGIYDMTGNAWEWCSDWYGSYPTGAQTNPKGVSTGSLRVLRGGSEGHDAWDCRSASRGKYFPSHRRAGSGFRVVLP